MTDKETLKNPVTPETGPKPLTASNIESNSIRLKMGEVKFLKPEHPFYNIGLFLITMTYPNARFHHNSHLPYWSQELLNFDPKQHTLQTSKYGNLMVYETKGETSISAQNKPKIIIEAKDIRAVDAISLMKGEVRPSGYVFPKNFPPFPLGCGQRISSEELERMLLEAERHNEPQSSYSDWREFAKVDPRFANKDVLLIPFCPQYEKSENLMKTDAVVIDLAERKLIPRIFYRLDIKE